MTLRQARTAFVLVLTSLVLLSTTVLAMPSPSRPLRMGYFGGDVIALQRVLERLGYLSEPVNGIFGASTQGAVIDFQRAYGLAPDGVADTWTLRAMDRADMGTPAGGRTPVRSQTETVAFTLTLTQYLVQGLDETLARHLTQSMDESLAENLALSPIEIGALSMLPSLIQRPAPDPNSALTPSENANPDSIATSAPNRALRHPIVLGYTAEDWIGDTGSLNSLRSSMRQVDLMVNFQMLIDAQGHITTRDYPALMAEARAQSIPVHGLVHNLTGGGFDPAIARAILSNPTVRARAIENMIEVVHQQGLAGLNIDIENVPSDQRENYTALVRELSARLHGTGLALTLSIPAKTYDDRQSPWSGAFDYAALGKHADWIIPMTYDEHSLGHPAGPVASIRWVERVAAFAASQIPPQKVLLGIAAYGYDWVQGSTGGRGLSSPGAMRLAAQHGRPILWDDAAQVPYFTYVANGQSRIVYFENAYSTARKLDLVHRYGLGGIGIWRLGQEDPAIWTTIADRLR